MAVALAHAAVIVMVVKRGALRWLTDRLAAVGQTALSNYIATSVVCALLFYTPGLGLMGQLQRYQLYGVVVGIWILNLAWSPWWLRRYRFGPLEWCWRSLTYGSGSHAAGRAADCPGSGRRDHRVTYTPGG